MRRSNPRSHKHHDVVCVGSAAVVKEVVAAARLCLEGIHRPLHCFGHSHVKWVGCLSSLEEDVGILGRTPQHRLVRIECPTALSTDQLVVDHGIDRRRVERRNLGDLVAGTKPVEEVQEGHAGCECGRMSNQRQVLCLLDRS